METLNGNLRQREQDHIEERRHTYSELLRLGHEVFEEYFEVVKGLSIDEKLDNNIRSRALAPFVIDKIDGLDFSMFLEQPKYWGKTPEEIYSKFLFWVLNINRSSGLNDPQRELMVDFVNYSLSHVSEENSSEDFLERYYGERVKYHAKNNKGITDYPSLKSAEEDMEFLLMRLSTPLYSKPAIIFTSDKDDPKSLYLHFNRVSTHPTQGVLREQLKLLSEMQPEEYFRQRYKNGSNSQIPSFGDFSFISGITHLLGEKNHAKRLLAIIGLDIDNLPENVNYTLWDPNKALLRKIGQQTDPENLDLGKIFPSTAFKAAFLCILMSKEYMKQFIREAKFPMLGTIRMSIETMLPGRRNLEFA